MDLKYLKLVKTIVEEGNISKSADRLFLSKSALSHQLREFEERYGMKVFIRSRNNWKLTREGEEIYELAKEVILRIDEGIRKIGSIQQGSQGLIRLSTECYSFYHALPGFIGRMNILYPEIEIQLKVEATHHPLPQLLSDELDICIMTEQPHSEEVVVHELFQDELFAVLSNEHVLADKDFLMPSDFTDQHLVIHSYPLETVSVYQNFLKPAQVEPVKITAIPLTEVSVQLVAANMGVACFPKWALKSLQLPESLTFVPLGEKGLKRQHYLAYQRKDEHKQYIGDFVDNLLEEPLWK